jgi:hypothetical protein
MSEITNKEILYKIYDSSGNFITTWTDVVSDLNISYTLNGGISNLTVRLARLESSFGEGEDVEQGNLLKVYVFDGDSGTSGVCVYSGILVSYTPIISGGEENVDVEFYSHFWDLSNKILEVGGNTEITYNSKDPSYILWDLMRKYNAHNYLLRGSWVSSLKFNGTSAKVKTSAIAAEITRTGTFSISLWFYCNDTSITQAILQNSASTSDRNGISIGAGVLRFGYYDGGAYTGTSGSISSNTWYHILCTNNGGTLKLYINAVLQSGVSNPSLGAVATGLFLGTREGTDRWFGGKMTDLRVFGSVLDADDALDLYHGKTIDTPVNQYPFTEKTGATLTDLIEANNGTITNATWSSELPELYSPLSIQDTGTTVSYTFNTDNYQEAVKTVIELCPENWFFRIGADDKIYLEEMESTPSHYFTIGKDIMEYKPEKRFDNIVNTIYFRGADTLYKKYTNSGSVNTYGTRAISLVDSRVSVEATADTMTDKILDEKNSPEIRVVLKIMDNNGEAGEMGYDIESIKVGQTCKIENATSKSNNLWDEALWETDAWDYDISNASSIQLQIVKLDYTLDYAILELSNRQPEISKRIEDINRNLVEDQTADNPTTPTT